MRTAPRTRTIRGTVNADGTVAAGQGFTVSKSGTGTYVVTFARPFAVYNPPSASLTPATSGTIPMVGSISHAAIQVVVRNTGATLTDQPFHFTITGEDLTT